MLGDLSENFDSVEFVCPCCGRADMDLGFITRFLQPLRHEYGKPIKIVPGGGFRCVSYDGKNGTHTEGRAVDVGCPQEDYPWLIEAAFYYGATGVGVKSRMGQFQLHLDTGESKPGRPRPWIWTYI